MIAVRRKVQPPAHLLPRAALTHHCQFRRLGKKRKKEIYFCKFWWRSESNIKKAQIKVTTDRGQWRLWDRICPLPLLASPWGKSPCLSYCTCACMRTQCVNVMCQCWLCLQLNSAVFIYLLTYLETGLWLYLELPESPRQALGILVSLSSPGVIQLPHSAFPSLWGIQPQVLTLEHLTLCQRSRLPTTSSLSRKNSAFQLKDYRTM